MDPHSHNFCKVYFLENLKCHESMSFRGERVGEKILIKWWYCVSINKWPDSKCHREECLHEIEGIFNSTVIHHSKDKMTRDSCINGGCTHWHYHRWEQSGRRYQMLYIHLDTLVKYFYFWGPFLNKKPKTEKTFPTKDVHHSVVYKGETLKKNFVMQQGKTEHPMR